MSLFFSLFPLYILGNLHCLGMCGPLAVMIGNHSYRHLYFLGRLLSYSLAGWLAGELGALLHLILQSYFIPALMSFLFALIIFIVGICSTFGWQIPYLNRFFSLLAPINRSLSLLMLKDQPWPSFLFGFFTVLLPCGQTVVVFSACALYGDGLVGFFNGFAFALFTSPSLIASMRLHTLFKKSRRYYNLFLGISALLVASLAFCRGMAELGWIPHLIIYSNLVLY